MELFDTVTFTSGKFKPVLPDDCQVNPGRYGAELAYWLCVELAKARIVTSYPNYEDWGWYLEYTSENGDEFRLCCGNVDGTDDEWLCYLEPLSKGLLRGKARLDSATPLLEGIKGVLSRAEDIANIEWSKDTR